MTADEAAEICKLMARLEAESYEDWLARTVAEAKERREALARAVTKEKVK